MIQRCLGCANYRIITKGLRKGRLACKHRLAKEKAFGRGCKRWEDKRDER